jgi:haloalkane dehalogenase
MILLGCGLIFIARWIIWENDGKRARSADIQEDKVKVLRTPDARFENLPDFPYQPHYIQVNGLRVHYVDEGQGEIILCLHGEPTWSFLYRKMIPTLATHYRVMAMDFIGFGRSDKYADQEAYSFQMHFDTLVGFIEELSLEFKIGVA